MSFFQHIETRNELADFLGIPRKKLTHLLYVQRIENCYHMFGISSWNDRAGANLEQDIKSVYNLPGGKERYWDQVALEYFRNHYQIEVRPCCFDDIKEFDNYRDLRDFDESYQ